MKTSENIVLITGGATGIGFALAEALVEAGNQVIICGRREGKLEEARKRVPTLITKVCDLSKREEREKLFKWIEQNHGGVNVLVNNAGIQRIVNFKHGARELLEGENEVEINLTAQIELAAYFVPFLMEKRESAIVNISSGLAFMPIALFPVYCATKAAIHSFTVSLRQQLKGTSVKVFEVAPPTTETELDRGMRAKRGAEKGVPPDEVASEILKGLAGDEFEIAIEEAHKLREDSRKNFDQAFDRIHEKMQF